jgi:LPXTG-site transpeptidase (sortase) family protein
MPIPNLAQPMQNAPSQQFYGEKETKEKSESQPRSVKRALLSSLVTAIAVSGWAVAGVLYFGNQAPQTSETVMEDLAGKLAEGQDLEVMGAETIDTSTLDSDGDGLLDKWETRFGTEEHNADTDFDGFSDGEEVQNGYDPTGTGRPEARVVIDKLALNVPLQFAQSRIETDIQENLQNGPVHYFGSAMPGTVGNTYITGHSSDYVWAKGDYKTVFSRLGEMEANDIVQIAYRLNNGEVVTFNYQIYNKQVVDPSDACLFQPEPSPVLTLVTSWPIGSTKERLMIKAALVN